MFGTCSDIESCFDLSFIENYTPNDGKVIANAIRFFKDPNLSKEVVFLESRDIHNLGEFFVRYGKDVSDRSFEKYGCEKIEGKYCICFIENPNQVLIDKITHVMKIYRGEKSSYRDDNTFILMTDLDISIISDFIIRYGKSLEEEKRQMQTMSMMNANVVAW